MHRLLSLLRSRLRPGDPDLTDQALEAFGRTCDDCGADPYEPCRWHCSTWWT